MKNVSLLGILIVFSTLNASVDNYCAKKTIDSLLWKQNRTVSQIPSSIYSDYQNALSGSPEALDHFITLLKNIVLPSEIEKFADKTIDEKLAAYSTSAYWISNSSQYTLKRQIIISSLNHLLSNNNRDFLATQEVRAVVNAELTTSNITIMKEEAQANSTNWTEAVANIFSAIGNLFSTSSDTTHTTCNCQKPLTTIYESDMCPICQEQFVGEERIAVLNCGHVYHPECIKESLKHNTKCPLCRQDHVYQAKIFDSKQALHNYLHPQDFPPVYHPSTPQPDHNPEIDEDAPSAPDIND